MLRKFNYSRVLWLKSYRLSMETNLMYKYYLPGTINNRFDSDQVEYLPDNDLPTQLAAWAERIFIPI